MFEGSLGTKSNCQEVVERAIGCSCYNRFSQMAAYVELVNRGNHSIYSQRYLKKFVIMYVLEKSKGTFQGTSQFFWGFEFGKIGKSFSLPANSKAF